jgi:hypothetical protein
MTGGFGSTMRLRADASGSSVARPGEAGEVESSGPAGHRNNWRQDQLLSDDDRVNTERWGGMAWRARLGGCAGSGVSDVMAGGKGIATGDRVTPVLGMESDR